MSEFLCDILRSFRGNGSDYFSVYSIAENKEYIIPAYQLSRHNIEIGKRYYFTKEQNSQSNKVFLKYLRPQDGKNHIYKPGETYDFKIVGFESRLNKKREVASIINVEDNDKNIISVLALKWQKSDIWKYGTLKCKVQEIINNGVPKLLNNDFRHPFYEVNQEYDFKIVGEKIKTNENGDFHVFVLKGEDGCFHDVTMTPDQAFRKTHLKTIRCRIKDITYRLRLSQAIGTDQFFVTFDKIVDNKYLDNKYFSCYLNDPKPKLEIAQLVDQYNSQSAFWVFTFTNKILVNLFRDCIERRDYKQAREVNSLIITFENWIITKGIITSLTDSNLRSRTKARAKKALETAKIQDIVLVKLCNNDYNFAVDSSVFQKDENLFEKIYYVFYFSDIQLLDDSIFFKEVINAIQTHEIKSSTEVYFLDKLLKRISYNKNIFITEEEKEYFSLSTSSISADKFSNREAKYLNWSYVEILLAQKLSMKEHLNILSGQLLRLFTKSIHEIGKKEFLLFNAYRYFDNYTSSDLEVPFLYKEQLSLNFDYLENNASDDYITISNWDNLENLFTSLGTFSVRLTKKSKTGYEVTYKKLKGFLPYHHLKDRTLKNYPFEECDFTINAKCLSISRNFNFFTVEQVSTSDFSDSYKNNLLFEIGYIYDAYVKNVVSYGLFLTTSAGEGLLHANEIFDFEWDVNAINQYFKVGQRLRVLLKNINKENKPEFNFFELKTLEPLYYSDYVENLFDKNASNFIESLSDVELDTYFERALHEKAYCIEQFAVLQLDLNTKLQNFHLAKLFYTNAKNARSFLLNIYISYFEMLLRIKETIQTNSLAIIPGIKAHALEIKNKINQKTIATFPDSDRLVFFLDIISMFNEKDETSFEHLFKYVKNYGRESRYKDLRTIAKITLANNLLISESKEDSDFILRNLRLIYNYLSNGILSLEESIDDKNARELKEDILYWREKIKGDESETLEFKSSFYTPILDEKARKRLELLNSLDKKNEKSNLEIRRISGDLAHLRVTYSALRTLVAFANSSGGTLLIGVDNDKNILGLEQEYQSSKLQYPSRDGYGLYFDEMVRNYIGDSFSSLMNRRFLRFPEGDILIVKVEQSSSEVFLRKDEEGKACEQLYIRNLSSSKELTGSEMAKFIQNRIIAQFTKTTTGK